MKILLLTCLLSSLVFDLTNAECGPNEIYIVCQPCAAINCGDISPEICLDVCQNAGCYCDTGYLYKDGVCVLENECEAV